MKLSVYFTPLGVAPSGLAGKPALVLDILRATTTIVTALANGARAVLPVPNADEALRIAQTLERDDVLLAGERRAEKIPGFALGNSPLEMTPAVVSGKTLVMATTNGTPALVAAEPARPVIVAAAVNFTVASQAARAAFEEAGELVILCAGRERMFALEDGYAAGRFAQAVIADRAANQVDLNDAAIAAMELARRYGERWKRALTASAAARDLQQLGFKQDVLTAAEVDRHPVVPLYAERHVTVPARG